MKSVDCTKRVSRRNCALHKHKDVMLREAREPQAFCEKSVLCVVPFLSPSGKQNSFRQRFACMYSIYDL